MVRVVACIAACIGFLAAATPTSPALLADENERLSIDQTIVADDGASVTALVSVLDATGRPVTGLTDFQVEIEGGPVDVASVTPAVDEERGIAVLLLLDVSGSMAGEPLAQAQAAAGTLVRGLLERDVAALLPFASAAPTDVSFTTSREALLRQIEATRVDAVGGTALFDAVVDGLDVLALRAPTARRAVVLLTDGRDSGDLSEHSREEALGRAANGGVPIFAVGLGADADTGLLSALAGAAGGAFYQAPTPADVPAIFDLIAETLRSQYALTLPLNPDGGARQELLVRVQAGERTLTARADVLLRPPDAASPAGGSVPVVAIGLVSLLAVVVVGGGALLIRKRRRRPVPYGGAAAGSPLSVRPETNGHAEASAAGRLTVVAGPNEGTSVLLVDGAISIGSDPACALRLDAGESVVAGTHARVWLQRGRLMVHHLARSRETHVQERPVEWAALEPHDVLRIGPHVIEFLLESPT